MVGPRMKGGATIDEYKASPKIGMGSYFEGFAPTLFLGGILKYTHTFDTSKIVLASRFKLILNFVTVDWWPELEHPPKLGFLQPTVNPSMFTPMNGEEHTVIVEAPIPGKDPINNL